MMKHVVNGDQQNGWYCYQCDFTTRNVAEAAEHDGTSGIDPNPRPKGAGMTEEQNIAKEMADHDKHYWCLVRNLQRRKKNAGDLADLIGEGSTVAEAIWNKYAAMESLSPSPAPEVMGTPLERAAQKMAEAYGWGWEHMGNEAKATFRKMAKAALEVLQPDPWVDVKVGLPKDEVAKLVFVQETLCSFTAYYDGCDWLSFEPNGRSTVIWGVTHWREIQNDIPAPPPETRATEGK